MNVRTGLRIWLVYLIVNNVLPREAASLDLEVAPGSI